MIAKIQAYAAIALSIALAVLYALFNRERAKRYRDKAKTAKQAVDTLTQANKAIREADEAVKKKLCAKDPDRTHFQ